MVSTKEQVFIIKHLGNQDWMYLYTVDTQEEASRVCKKRKLNYITQDDISRGSFDNQKVVDALGELVTLREKL